MVPQPGSKPLIRGFRGALNGILKRRLVGLIQEVLTIAELQSPLRIAGPNFGWTWGSTSRDGTLALTELPI